MTTPEDFLQFLYDHNVICYIEYAEDAHDEKFIRWCFHERNSSNINPKVQLNRDYELHYGLSTALNMGKELRRKSKAKKSSKVNKDGFSFGVLLNYDRDKQYGFIRQDGLPVDIFFHKNDLRGRVTLTKGTRLRYRLTKRRGDKLAAVDVMETRDTS